MQYKRLSLQELQSLETDFIKYLSLQGIEAENWEKIKQSENEKFESLLDDFSDMVYGAAIEQIRFLMKSENEVLFVFEMCDDIARLYIFKINGEISSVGDIASGNAVFISSTEKIYSKSRNMEIFQMLESGCTICTQEVYKAFKALVK